MTEEWMTEERIKDLMVKHKGNWRTRSCNECEEKYDCDHITDDNIPVKVCSDFSEEKKDGFCSECVLNDETLCPTEGPPEYPKPCESFKSKLSEEKKEKDE